MFAKFMFVKSPAFVVGALATDRYYRTVSRMQLLFIQLVVNCVGVAPHMRLDDRHEEIYLRF